MLPLGLAVAFGVSCGEHPWPEFAKQAVFAMLMLTIDRINRRTLIVANALLGRPMTANPQGVVVTMTIRFPVRKYDRHPRGGVA